MSIVVDMTNPMFCELKAIEQIMEAHNIMKSGSMTSADYIVKLDQYHEKIAQAISLLGLARLQRGMSDGKSQATPEAGTGKQDTRSIDGLLENP